MSKKVLITAGAGGIGFATATAFAAEGHRVHIADINAEAVAAAVASHENITGSVTDVSQADSVQALFDDLQKELGGLDVLINMAGIGGPTVPAEGLDPEAWNAILGINLTGTFMVTQRAIPLLKQSEAGTIVTMSSLAGRFGYENRIGYSTTKWGLVGFAKTLSLELGQYGITSNTIHPGAVAGPRMDSVLAGRAEANGTSLEAEQANALQNQSVKEFIDAADIAALIIFLAGPHGRTITGQQLPIDGDSKAAS
ncbi:3-oxoacyl-ACP reductase FabG [Citricoccus sp. NPDC055426]|uniref:3-oxoacyl-ACP reductase FabG n=1 Tax=Citricoccus sp. NPDC055426 TaxID=3155536 RepID=UPI00342685EC